MKGNEVCAICGNRTIFECTITESLMKNNPGHTILDIADTLYIPYEHSKISKDTWIHKSLRYLSRFNRKF